MKLLVRRQLATGTATEHEALHHHPWISSFVDPDLTVETYFLVLGAYHSFLSDIETARQRLGDFDNLSLEVPLAHLTADLETAAPSPADVPSDHGLQIGSNLALLANLYVIHDAGFGASTLNAHVAKTLPEVSRHYIGAGTSPVMWRDLLHLLESIAGRQNDIDILISAATASFRYFGKHVSAVCEANQSQGQLKAG